MTRCTRGLVMALALLPAAGHCGDPPTSAPDRPAASDQAAPIPPAPGQAAPAGPDGAAVAPAAAGTQRGLDVYARFREGLADPDCPADGGSVRWRRHFARAPGRLGERDDDALALFGYVVDALREASLPTEYALIPFVESGYKPGARSKSGPAGLWQMAAVTARAHGVPIRPGYDGRLSPVESTRAAVRYLKTLHGMFAGDWRLAAMAYNAGEYRVFGALRRAGQVARDADPEKLTSLSGITRAYVRKLHALSCLLGTASERDAWLRSMDRAVPVLEAVPLPRDARDLARWARAEGRDAAMVRRLNPAFAGGRVARVHRALQVLAPTPPGPAPAEPAPALPMALALEAGPTPAPPPAPAAPSDAPPDAMPQAAPPAEPGGALPAAASGPAPATQAH